MLPSKGYFSTIPCVFYLGKGCRRPCCHYRHSLQDVKRSRDDTQFRKDKVSALSNTWSTDQVDIVTKLVEKAVDKVFREEPSKHLKMGKTDMVRDTLNKILLDEHAVKWARSIKSETSEVPVYEPTPIAKLNDRHIPVVCVPEKPLSKPNQCRFQAISNTYFIGEESHDKSTRTQQNLADSSGTLYSYAVSGGDSLQTRDDEYMECDSPGLDNDSCESQSFYQQKFQCGGTADLQESNHKAGLICTGQNNNLSSSNVNQLNSFQYGSPSSAVQDSPVQPDSNFSVINEPQKIGPTFVNYYTETTTTNIIPTVQSISEDLNHTQTKEDKSNSIKKSHKHDKKNPQKHKKLDDKETDCGNVSQKILKKPSRLKDQSLKTNSGASKSENSDKELENLKRRNSDSKCEVGSIKKPKKSNKKAKVSKKHANEGMMQSITNSKTEDNLISCDAPPLAPTTMDCSDSQMSPPTPSKEKPIEKPKIDLPGEKNDLKSTACLLKVSASADPFTRWMKNKRIREILGKRKTPKSTDGTALKNDKQINKQMEEIPKNTTGLPVVKCKDPEPLPAPKFTQRIAHEKDEAKPYPTIIDTIKIPLAFRQHFCNAFFQEFKKTMSVQEAKLQAVQKELDVANNSGLKSYKNNGSLQLMKLRKNVSQKKVEEPVETKLTPSSCPNFTFGWSLFKCFSKYLLTESEMRENGYPFPVPGKPNCAFVEKSARIYSKVQPSKPSVKVCANCSEKFRIGKDGVPKTKNDCFYHWGRLRKVRSMGQWLEKFSCCDAPGDATPCESSTYHVWSGRDEDCMEDFIETTKLPSYMEDCDAGIYALDCEMCYTSKGLELARLTVVDLNEEVVFDQVVSLDRPVLDYCTRFSGIDENKIRKATYTFEDVRAWILSNIFDKTILIGHSLENDLKALKLIHRTVIDTSVTFPHKFGPPNRLSLKHLASSLLRINIQEEEGGHDSKEDAATCLKLLMMKIREDSKIRKPRVIIGYNGKKR